jgi:hypothetical protein
VPRYFFHLRYEHESLDDEGVNLPDFHAACVEGVRAFGEMLQAQDCSPKPGLPLEMTITDDAGTPLCRLCFLAELWELPR